MDYKKAYGYWSTDAYFDAETRNELLALTDEKEIEERFYKDLEFGTGGLRGVLGAGTNRMNIYTVSKATQGLCDYINKQGVGNPSAVIAYDSRRMSAEFALAAALVFAGNGIKAYLFESLRPVPVLSFSVRHFKATAGVEITASHNPPEYNGYKVYWSDGGQTPYPRDEEIITEVAKVTDFTAIKRVTRAEAEERGLLVVVGGGVDDAYTESVKAQTVRADVIAKTADSLKIVYTPLHGSGNVPVRRVLSELGFKNVFVVPEQEKPDGNFPTVDYPNPEDPKAFTLAMKLAAEKDADLIVGTDPDADRVGVVVKNSQGEYVILTGNMTGALLCEYILSQKAAKGELPSNGAVISTIVSTDMTKEITKSYKVAYFDVLTGFKYIGEKIKQFEDKGDYAYIFGFEESYGCLAGTYARDKDAVVAVSLICEMAAYYKTRNMTLYDGLLELYGKYGYYKESIRSITLKGLDGLGQIKRIMAGLRQNPPTAIGGQDVAESRDYKSGKIVRNGVESPTNLPVSDVLYYTLADGSWFCVRPSGTEPKIKIYFGVKGSSLSDAEERRAALESAVMTAVDAASAS